MFYKGKRVLVTGGTGFVGSYFVEELLKQGARIRVPIHTRASRIQSDQIEFVQANLENNDDCLRVCKEMDYVIHAAGAVSAAGTTVNNPMSAITTNLVLTARILEAAWKAGNERILIFSSSTGYPDLQHPVKEDEFWAGPTHPVYFGYGWMRRYIERMGEFVHSKSSTKVAIVRPTAVYGRHDDFDDQTSHVIPALIKRAVAKENPFVVWGSPKVVRDFLHITDMVKGALLLLEKHAQCDPVNIGYGSAVTVGDIVKIVLSAAGHENADVRFDESKPTTIPFRMADITKARNLLGFEPFIDLRTGLIDTVAWYQNTLNVRSNR
jgi:GDP-L-fucose synthase